MRKYSIIALILIGITGAYVFATTVFPDVTPGFPRIPMGTGSIGQILGQLLGVTDLNNPGDGTVQNSLALSGISASGYLQNNDCLGGEVWLRIDANGKAVCGNK